MKLEKIMRKIIKESFPELANIDISIDFEDSYNIDDCYFLYGNKEIGFFIDVDKSLETAEQGIIVGGIAHELCHILWECSVTKYYERHDSRLYKKHFLHRQRDEKYTDLETILRGYGPELLLVMKHYQDYPTKDYAAGKYCGLTYSDLIKLRSI